MTPTDTGTPFTLSTVLEHLHMDRGRALLIGLCVALLVGGLIVGRGVGGATAPKLQTPAVATAKSGNQSTLVEPAPITVPQRAKQ